MDSDGTATGKAREEVLEALRFDYGGYYLIGFSEELGWYASRHIGHVITAGEPDELRAAMKDDFGAVPA